MARRKLAENIIKEIHNLRSKGNSLPEISQLLNIPKTTVFNYAKNVVILPKFAIEWAGKRGGNTRRKAAKEKQFLIEARDLVGNLSKRDKIHFLAALYWAEGSKKDFGLSNTDPKLIKVFVNGLRDIYEIPNARFRVSIRIYEDMDREKCLNFWSKVVRIPKENFVSVNVLLGKKKGKLEFGMCRVRVSKGGDLLKKLKAVNEIISSSVENKANLK
jgi:hypothetical protein